MKAVFQFASPLIIIIMVFFLNRYISYSTSINKNLTGCYKYPKLIIYMLYASFILPLLLYFAPDRLTLGAKTQFYFIEIVSSLIITLLIIYCSKYSISINIDKLEFGAFFKSEIRYKSIQSVRYHWVNNGQFVKMTMVGGKSKTFEKGIEDFDGFAKNLYKMLDKSKVSFTATGRASFF